MVEKFTFVHRSIRGAEKSVIKETRTGRKSLMKRLVPGVGGLCGIYQVSKRVSEIQSG